MKQINIPEIDIRAEERETWSHERTRTLNKLYNRNGTDQLCHCGYAHNNFVNFVHDLFILVYIIITLFFYTVNNLINCINQYSFGILTKSDMLKTGPSMQIYR